MTDLKIIPLGPAAKSDTSDGRRQRSERSRSQIIEAMFSLIREGEMSPSAARVAERAEVGLRTVFRHFEDMDSLYVEMAERISSEVMPKILAPFEASEWRERFFENLREVHRLGYPDSFVRLWEYYLCYCEGGFAERQLGNVQLLLTKPDCRRAPVGASMPPGPAAFGAPTPA